jgi:hypothetical protein
MTVALLSANLGRFDMPMEWVPQVVPGHEVSVHRFDDHTFPPRTSLTPRLQAKAIKVLGYQFVPNADVYVWVDASFALLRDDCVAWLLEQMGSKDAVFFKHPFRQTVGEERAFLKAKLAEGNQYITKRYAGEWDGPWPDHDPLYAAGIFAYRPTAAVLAMLDRWWQQIARYHINDQLSLPWAIRTSTTDIAVIDADIYGGSPFTFVRTREWLKKGSNRG